MGVRHVSREYAKGWQAAARGVVWPLRISGAASCKREGVVLFRGGQEIFAGKKVLFRGGDSVEEKEIFLKRMTREGGEFWGKPRRERGLFMLS